MAKSNGLAVAAYIRQAVLKQVRRDESEKGWGEVTEAGPTDVLTEDVKELRGVDRDLAVALRESNRQLGEEIKRVFDRLSGEMRDSNLRMADAMRDSNLRLTDAINRLAGDFGNFRVEVAKDLGTVNASIQTLKGEVAKDLGAINTNLEPFKGRTETSLSVARWAVGVVMTVVLGLVAWSYSAYARAVHIEDSIVARGTIPRTKTHGSPN